MNLGKQLETRHSNRLVGGFLIIAFALLIFGLSQSGTVDRWLNPLQKIKVLLPQEGLFGLSAGANVEILERVGKDNIFIFGLTAEEALGRQKNGHNPGQLIEENPVLKSVLTEIAKGTFSEGDRDRFGPLLNDLYHHDYFMITADFASYMAAQADVGRAYRDRQRWFRSAILNTAGTGWFSSDRTIRSYDETIWRSKPSLHFECVRS